MKRHAPPSKEELIKDYLENRAAIMQAARDLPPEAHNNAFVGEWTIKELLAHLCGWDFTYLTAFEQVLKGEVPSFYAHYSPSWKRINERLIKEYRRADLEAMLAMMQDSQAQMVAFMQRFSDDDIFKDRGIRAENGYHVTIGGLLRSAVYEEYEHLEQIRGFARSLAQNAEEQASLPA